MGKKSFLNRLKRILLYLSRKYDQLQKNEIILGEDKGLPVYFYKKQDFDWMQMREIRLGLEKELDVSHYAKKNMSVEQMEEIRLGLEKDLDVSFFNNPDFDWMQMREVRLGLDKGLDVSNYAKEKLSVEQMEEIRLGLEKGLDVSLFNNADFDRMQMREVRLGLEQNLDTSFYSSSEYNWQQMREIRIGMKQGINIYEYISSETNWKEMKQNRLEQLKKKFTETESIDIYTKKELTGNKELEKRNENNIAKANAIENKIEDTIYNTNNKFLLSKFDVNVIFPLIKEFNTDELLKKNINETYKSTEYANKTYNMRKKRIEKLVTNGYIEVVDGKYLVTQKAIEESKNVSQEFEFTSFDATKVFGYILKAGGCLSLKQLKEQISKEYTKDTVDKEFTYLANRLENNYKKGYVIKNEDNSFSISDLGRQKAKEIRQMGTIEKESQIEEQLEEELEV